MKLPAPKPIYLDYHSTTPVDPRVAALVMHTMTTAFGNANSMEHAYGEVAAGLVANARLEVADLVNADPEEVYFTSGSSDSIRCAIQLAVSKRKHGPLRVAITMVEHRAVLDAVAAHELAGEVSVRWLPVDRQARLDMEALEAACADGVDLVCVMAANNEVGTIYPIEDVVRTAAEAGAATLIDATQAAGRYPIQTSAWGITYLTISAHKIYGPKGVGALVMPAELTAKMSHDSTPGTGRGTPNVPGIVGLGEACRLRRVEMANDEPRITDQRDQLESLLLAAINGLIVNGDRECRLNNNLHVSIPDVPSDVIIARLHRRVAVSTGAACTSGAQENSHVLRAMGLPNAVQQGALRIGTGKFTTDEEIECAAEYIAQAVAATRAAMGG